MSPATESPVWALLNSMKERHKLAEGNAQKNREHEDRHREAVASLRRAIFRAASEKNVDGERLLEHLLHPKYRGKKVNAFITDYTQKHKNHELDTNSLQNIRASQDKARKLLATAADAQKRAAVMANKIDHNLKKFEPKAIATPKE